jgi:hypothetical protein
VVWTKGTFRLITLLVAIASARCAGPQVQCEACYGEGISVRSNGRPLRAIVLGSDCADARQSPATYVGDEYEVPQYNSVSFSYGIYPVRPGPCSFDVTLEDGRLLHYAVDMILVDQECCFGIFTRDWYYGDSGRIVVPASQADAGPG